MYVIGTAGHVDHGKSTLVKALTGIEPDRLREEKVRGLTIDLGFAWMELPSGRSISIVDVPGHERFIKNMLAGAGGVDLALIIVAADEGPMPQTIEHLQILELLDIPDIIIVITKCALVESEFVDLIQEEISEVLTETRFKNAPIARVDALTSEGLPDLCHVIDSALDNIPPKRDFERPRLPIDRAFTIKGFGAVVTGTLLDGPLFLGQDVHIQPGGLNGRIRGLQRHATSVEKLDPGTRAAVNLSGIRTEQLQRGMVLSAPGTMISAHSLDVLLKGSTNLKHPIQNNAVLTFLSATSETQAKVRLLNKDTLEAGDSVFAQLVLDQDVAVLVRDHCILRTPNDTVAGGPIVTINPRKYRRYDSSVIEVLKHTLEGSVEGRLISSVAVEPYPKDKIASLLGVSESVAVLAIKNCAKNSEVTEYKGFLYGSNWVEAAITSIHDVLQNYFLNHPLKRSAPRNYVQSDVAISGVHFDFAIESAVAEGIVEISDSQRSGELMLPDRVVSLTDKQKESSEEFLAILREGSMSPPTGIVIEDELLAWLIEGDVIVDTGSGIYYDRVVFGEIEKEIKEHILENGSASLAEVRDLLGISRKYAQAILEHLDVLQITRRTGDVRLLR
tara:strand:- start:7314 stop:9164 length:1851 start_codon:yes stop_codon:yes gene_type:complete